MIYSFLFFGGYEKMMYFTHRYQCITKFDINQAFFEFERCSEMIFLKTDILVPPFLPFNNKAAFSSHFSHYYIHYSTSGKKIQ
jgi:hypothetical protein